MIGIEDRRVDVEDQVAFQRLGLQQIEAGGVLQAEDELAVGELVDAGQLHLDDAAQQGRQHRRRSCGRSLRAGSAAPASAPCPPAPAA